MITLTILLIVALLCVLVGCLTGLLSLVGVLASLFVGVLVGALAGYLAGRFMGTETSLGRNILMGVLGSFVGEFLFGLLGIHASGSFSSFAISVIGACICIWIGQKRIFRIPSLFCRRELCDSCFCFRTLHYLPYSHAGHYETDKRQLRISFVLYPPTFYRFGNF